MSALIDLLFYETLEKTYPKEVQDLAEKLSDADKKLRDTLSKEQELLLSELENFQGLYHCALEKELYHLGFRAGCQILLEGLKE